MSHYVNIHGVATNPTCRTIHSDENFKLKVLTAFDGDKWASGYQLYLKGEEAGTFYIGELPNFNTKCARRGYYPNEWKAIYARVREAKKTLESRGYDVSNLNLNIQA